MKEMDNRIGPIVKNEWNVDMHLLHKIYCLFYTQQLTTPHPSGFKAEPHFSQEDAV